MNGTATIAVASSPSGNRKSFLGRGFRPDGGCYRHGDLLAEPLGSGWRFHCPWPSGLDPLEDPGLAGPWRHEPVHGRRSRVLTLPGWLLDRAEPDVDEDVLGVALDWVLATARGDMPDAWSPPTEALTSELFPAASLAIQQGAVLRHARLLRAEGRFAVRLDLADAVPADLPGLRAAWLRRVLLETQSHWHLVRTIHAPGSVPAAVVDLSGVPGPLLRPLCRAGLESLRRIAGHLVELVEFLALSDSGNEALAFCRPQ